MKKKMVLLFRIIGIVLAIGFIFLIIFWKINRLRGNISITINEEEYFLDHLECRYEEENAEKVTYRKTLLDSGVTFKNSGSRYGMYEYSFLISNEEINIEPIIRVFKTNWYDIYVINIDFNVYEDNGIWNAEVCIETNKKTYQETFYDIKNNVIEMRVE